MHNITSSQFLELDGKYGIFSYIADCPDIFDGLTQPEMAKEIDEYIAANQWHLIPCLDFVLECRSNDSIPHDYDLVIGPTADDNTTLCLKYYFDGIYGKVGSYDAKELLMKNLEVENLGVQYYIGKQDIADKLILRIKEL